MDIQRPTPSHNGRTFRGDAKRRVKNQRVTDPNKPNAPADPIFREGPMWRPGTSPSHGPILDTKRNGELGEPGGLHGKPKPPTSL